MITPALLKIRALDLKAIRARAIEDLLIGLSGAVAGASDLARTADPEYVNVFEDVAKRVRKLEVETMAEAIRQGLLSKDGEAVP